MGAPTGILFSLLDEDAGPIACRPVECGGESLIEEQNLFKATEVLIEDKASGRVTRWQPSAINSWISWVSMIAVWAFSRMVLSVAVLLRARPRSLPAATVTVGCSTTREMTFSQEFFRRLAQECSMRNVHAFAGNFVVVDGAAIDCGPRDIPFA
jgi:hypothetical protein